MLFLDSTVHHVPFDLQGGGIFTSFLLCNCQFSTALSMQLETFMFSNINKLKSILDFPWIIKKEEMHWLCVNLSTGHEITLRKHGGSVTLFSHSSSLFGISHPSTHWRGKCFSFTIGRPSLELRCTVEFSECMKQGSWTAMWFLCCTLLWVRKNRRFSLHVCGCFCECMRARFVFNRTDKCSQCKKCTLNRGKSGRSRAALIIPKGRSTIYWPASLHSTLYNRRRYGKRVITGTLCG